MKRSRAKAAPREETELLPPPALPLADTRTPRANAIAGALLGTAVGDAIGLPYEGLSPKRARKIFGEGALRHRLLAGRGMVSDDTEHACMTAEALLDAPDDPHAFAASLGARMVRWLFALPAGVGLATLRSTLRLASGVPPAQSGVESAGNGPAMRAAILGVCLGDDADRLAAYVRASTRLTHLDARAEAGALVVALAAYYGMLRGPEGVRAAEFVEGVCDVVDEPDLRQILGILADDLERGASASAVARTMGLEKGVSGYMYHTVPMAIYCWLRNPGDVRAAVETAVSLGGDTDTVGAIVGALTGATAGAENIPGDWLSGIVEYPRTIQWMRRLATQLEERFAYEAGALEALRASGWTPQERDESLWKLPAVPVRNAVFLVTVLAHGFRRLLPPY